MTTMFNLEVVEFITEECIRQQSGMRSINNMIKAWDQAYWYSGGNNERLVDLEFIESLGKLVDPGENNSGFRQKKIFVSDGINHIEKAPWERIPELLTYLIEAYYEGRLDAEILKNEAKINGAWKRYKEIKKAKSAEDIFYLEYENIHPFGDGNGRTGKILYNYLKGTLEEPVLPPNFWNITNL